MKKLLSLFGTVALLSACTFTVTTDVNKDDAEPAEETVEEGTAPAEEEAPTEEAPAEEEPAMEDEAPTEEEAPAEEEPATEEETVEDGGDGNNADGGGTTVEVNVEAGTADDSSSEASAE